MLTEVIVSITDHYMDAANTFFRNPELGREGRNHFILKPMSKVHYGFIFYALCQLIFVLYTASYCFASKNVYFSKGLWILFILSGFGPAFGLNWIKGSVEFVGFGLSTHTLFARYYKVIITFSLCEDVRK